MYLEEVERLARYLMSPGLTVPEVCKFLVLETFARIKTSAIYAAEITEDGYIAPVGVFGLPKKVVEDWGNLSLTVDAPLTEAIRNDQIVLLLREEAFERYPVLITYDGIPAKWDSYLVCPILPYGVIALTLDSVPTVDGEFEKFIRAASSLAALYLKGAEFRVEHFNRKNPATKARRTGILTERQLMIKKMMEKGYSNPAIAAQIGYSESLVRQETMVIYSTLNISGRKDLLEGKPE
jgi:DNA-binding CsgD family transcriptional regulator